MIKLTLALTLSLILAQTQAAPPASSPQTPPAPPPDTTIALVFGDRVELTQGSTALKEFRQLQSLDSLTDQQVKRYVALWAALTQVASLREAVERAVIAPRPTLREQLDNEIRRGVRRPLQEIAQ